MAHKPDEYEYVAVHPIYVGTVRAFNAGDPVPATTVDEHGYADMKLVVKRENYKGPESHTATVSADDTATEKTTKAQSPARKTSAPEKATEKASG